MKTILIIVAAVIVLLVAFWSVWKTAKVSELHKVRAAFDNYDHILKEHYGDQPTAKLEGFEEGEKILDELEEKLKHELF